MVAAKRFDLEKLPTTDHALAAKALDGPAHHAARHIALHQLRQANAAAIAWHQGDNPEGLHDFRVAVRRVLSTLAAYEALYAGQPSATIRRRLKRIHSRTNSGRDLEVFVGFARSAIGEEKGGDALLKRLERESHKRALRSPSATVAAYAKLALKLESRLAEVTERHDLRVAPSTTQGREAIAKVVREQYGSLRARIDAFIDLSTSADRRGEQLQLAHDIRIHTKRLRYLTEAVLGHAPAAESVVSLGKKLQTTLGDLQDGATAETQIAWLKTRTTKPSQRGLVARLEQQNTDRVERCLSAFDKAVRSSKAPQHDLHEAVEALCHELLLPTTRARENHAERQANVEIERKYLLSYLPDEVRSHPCFAIAQGWLPGNQLRERLRRTERGGQTECYRTIKLGRGVRRFELEERCEATLFDQLWPLTEGCRVIKKRYKVPVGALTIEVDEFQDRDLVLAEVELEHEDQAVALPPWLTGAIVREVTEESAYVNLNLAQ